jgi:hypothetical protein
MLASPLPAAAAPALSQQSFRMAPAPPQENALEIDHFEPSEPAIPVVPAAPPLQVSASAGPDAPPTGHQVLMPITTTTNIIHPETTTNILHPESITPEAPDSHQRSHHTEDDTRQSDDESAASVAATRLLAPVLCALWAVTLL